MGNFVAGLFKSLVLFLGISLLIMIAIDSVTKFDYSLRVINLARGVVSKPRLQVAYPSCVKQPIEGSTFVFDYPALHSDSKMVQLELSNQVGDKSVLIHLNTPDNPSRKIVSALVPAMGSVSVDVPAAKYNVRYEHGQFFCNLRKGFLRSIRRGGLREPIDIESLTHATFKIEDGAISNSGLKISLTETQSEMNIVSSNSGRSHISIPVSRDGHFYLSAEGNGFPVVFLVDSGATNVSFPAHYMKNLNVQRCVSVTTNTANGVARGCRTTINQLKIGPYTINNVNAVFMEKLNTPLLGMNVLNKFSMYHVDDVLQLVQKR